MTAVSGSVRREFLFCNRDRLSFRYDRNQGKEWQHAFSESNFERMRSPRWNDAAPHENTPLRIETAFHALQRTLLLASHRIGTLLYRFGRFVRVDRRRRDRHCFVCHVPALRTLVDAGRTCHHWRELRRLFPLVPRWLHLPCRWLLDFFENLEREFIIPEEEIEKMNAYVPMDRPTPSLSLPIHSSGVQRKVSAPASLKSGMSHQPYMEMCSPYGSSPLETANYLPMSPGEVVRRAPGSGSFHSRGSSLAEETVDGYVPMAPNPTDDGYVDMEPLPGHRLHGDGKNLHPMGNECPILKNVIWKAVKMTSERLVFTIQKQKKSAVSLTVCFDVKFLWRP